MKKRAKDDTRRFRRRTVRILVDYTCDGGVRCEYATTLGAGGLYMETEDAIEPGNVMKMRFRLPDSEQLHEIEGRVAWVRSDGSGDGREAPGMGVQFTDSVACAKLARDLEDFEQ